MPRVPIYHKDNTGQMQLKVPFPTSTLNYSLKDISAGLLVSSSESLIDWCCLAFMFLIHISCKPLSDRLEVENCNIILTDMSRVDNMRQ